MNILIVKPSSIGDIIQGLRVAQAIRDQLPEAVISWVVRDRFADMVRHCPAVNGDVILFERSNGIRGFLRVFRDIRKKEYDAVLDFQGLLRSGLMTIAARSPLKLGHDLCREGSRWCYHRRVPLPPEGRNSHNVAVMLEFLPPLGLQARLQSPIVLTCEPPYDKDERLRGSRPVVLLPNSREPLREWPYFAELAGAILQNDASATVVWDSHLPFSTPPNLQSARFINLSTKTGLMDMVGLLRIARLVVANDSAGIHVAAALGVPALGLYGPTSPCKSGPFPLHNGTNHVLEAPQNNLSRLSVDEVLQTVLKLTDCEERSGLAA